MAVVGDLRGSGGAERQFSHLHEYLRDHGTIDSVFITSAASLERLRQVGRLSDDTAVVRLPLGAWRGGGRIGSIWLALTALWTTLTGRYDVVHICLPTPVYVPFAAIASRLPRGLRPLLTMTVIDCTVAPNLTASAIADLYERQVVEAHRMFFRWARLDGVFSWYQAFVHTARTLRLLPERATVLAARYCFADTTRFRPFAVKDRLVVYAGRLSAQKRPLLFVDAVASLCRRYPDLAEGWRFEMYGTGVLEQDVRRRIDECGLGSRLLLASAPDLSAVFGRSKVFVSTQAVENFTSLAMLEAMAAGNAIVAEAVGQTAEFVHDGRNGFVVMATADAFADALAAYIGEPSRHPAMAAHSRNLATGVHTIDNFSNDITAFWTTVTQQ